MMTINNEFTTDKTQLSQGLCVKVPIPTDNQHRRQGTTGGLARHEQKLCQIHVKPFPVHASLKANTHMPHIIGKSNGYV